MIETGERKMIDIDLILKPDYLIPVVPRGAVLQGHAVAIKDGVIVAVGPAAEVESGFKAARTQALTEQMLLPGLINAHTHSAMALLRGIADDLPLMSWLNDHIWPTEAKVLSPDFVRDGATLAVAEMFRGGITMINDQYFFPDTVAATADALGMRAMIGMLVIDFPTAWASNIDEYFSKGLVLHERWHDSSMIYTCLSPHAPYTVNDAGLTRVAQLSQTLDLPVHIHVHETAQEVEEGVAEHGVRPLARLEALNLVNPHLIAVHMTQLTDAEIALCARNGVSIVHCPESNLKLASGMARVEDLRQAGVNVAVGTDGSASNNDLDLIGEMRTAAMLGKAVASRADAMPAWYALEMATLNGAKALGFGQRLGSIEVGKWADLCSIGLDALEANPVYDLISHLIYSASRRDVRHVWVNGQQRLAHGELVDLDAGQLVATARKWQHRIERRVL